MNHRSSILIILIALSILFTGCKETPTTPFVADGTQEITTIESSQNQSPDTMDDASDIPSHINEDILTSEKYGSVYIDADVTSKVENPASIQTILPDRFSQEDVDEMVQLFFPGKQLYKESSEKTKEQIASEIETIQEELSHPENLTDDDISGMEYALNQLKEEYPSAPDQISGEPTSATLAINPESDNESLYVIADLGFKEASSLDVVNFRDGSLRSFMIVYLDYDKIFLSSILLSGKDAAGQVMSLADAQEKALEYKQALNLSGLELYDVQTGMTEDQTAQGYIATFRQGMDGTAIAKPQILDFSGTRQDLAATWPSDELRIKFDDDGISAIEWNNKGMLEGTTEQVQLISFDCILQTAEQQLRNKYAWNDHVQYQTEVHIDRIVLEYTLVPKRDDVGTFVLTPAWNFYGGILCVYEDGTTEELYEGRDDICHISINATTGSLIS